MSNRADSPRPLAEVMARDSDLGRLLARVGELARLQALLDARMGSGFAANCKVGASRPDGTLVLVARSPAWASRLRYLERDLVEWAGQTAGLAGIRAVEVHVERVPLPPAPPPR